MTLHDALAEVVGENELAEWLERPNPAFDGACPRELIERGEVGRVWQMVELIRTGHPI